MSELRELIEGSKLLRRFLWFFAIWFLLAFINDYLMMMGIGFVPIVAEFEYFAIDQYDPNGWENIFVISFHFITTAILFFVLLRKKGE